MVEKQKFPTGESPVKTIREDLLQMSQQEFASWLGIAISTVSRWENGKGKPMFTPGQFKLLIEKLSEHGYKLKDLPDDWSIPTGQV
ncbi:MAG: helix-turn-helix domain-containing protein [Cyanobacteria bacterium P01_C01_bin.120]